MHNNRDHIKHTEMRNVCIAGPILPVVPVKNMDEAIGIVNSRQVI